MVESVIDYRYVFDLGRPVEPDLVTDRILSTDVGVVSADPLGEDIEVANRFSQLLSLMKDASLLERLAKPEPSPLRDWLRAAARMPQLRLPVLTALVTVPFRSTPQTEATRDSWREIAKTTRESQEHIATTMANAQWMAAVHRTVEQDILRANYLEDRPFRRVDLQPFFAETVEYSLAIDVDLLIHRSGIGILTFHRLMYDRIQPSKLSALSISSNSELSKLELAEALIAHQAAEAGVATQDVRGARRFSSGITWIDLETVDGMNLTSVFDIYRDFMNGLVLDKGDRSMPRTHSWFMYPTISIRRTDPPIKRIESLEGRYRQELIALLARRQPSGLTDESIERLLSANVSSVQGRAAYLIESHAVLVFQSESDGAEKVSGSEWYWRETTLTVLIDIALIQYWITEVLGVRVRDARGDIHQLNEIRQEISEGVEEFHLIAPVNYVDAKDIVRQLRRILGVHEGYEALTRRLPAVEAIIESQVTERRYRRERTVRIATVVVTALFFLGAADQFVGVLSSWQMSEFAGLPVPLRSAISSVLTTVQDNTAVSTILLYIVSCTALIGAVLLPRRRRRRRQRSHARSSLVWPDSVRVVPRDSGSDDEDE